MSDDAYIQPSERRITSNESITVPCGCGRCPSCEFGIGTATIHRRITFDDHGLLASHAVMDSVAADLAGCLRESIDIFMDVKDWHPYDSLTPQPWELALARYDALHKEAGQ